MRVEDAKIVAALPALEVELRPASSLAELTSLGIGGTTDLLRIRKHESIPGLLSLLDSHGVPHRFIGGGSNLLVGDGELPWSCCSSRLQARTWCWKVILPRSMRPPTSAVRSPTAPSTTSRHGRPDRSPGTVGGALRMNAGAYGMQIGSYVRRSSCTEPPPAR